MEITLKVTNETDAAQAIAALSALYPTTPVLRSTAKEKLFASRRHPEMTPEPSTTESGLTTIQPTPLEQAIDTAAKDPFAALSAGMEPAATEAAETAAKTEKKPRKNAKKTEPASEPEKAEDKPLTLDDIRKASTVALELIGAPTIQEALAKFNSVDDKGVLRMSALREADYALYIQYLKKKVNDAAKEWPSS